VNNLSNTTAIRNQTPGKSRGKRTGGKRRMEYKEITLKDGTVFKGMIKTGTAEGLSKRKQISGTGELTSPIDQTVYKGTLSKGQAHGFGEKFWP
jgi:hypothetical protein